MDSTKCQTNTAFGILFCLDYREVVANKVLSHLNKCENNKVF